MKVLLNEIYRNSLFFNNNQVLSFKKLFSIVKGFKSGIPDCNKSDKIPWLARPFANLGPADGKDEA